MRNKTRATIFILFVVLLFAAHINLVFAQEGIARNSLSSGLSTTMILGNNPNSHAMVPREADTISGGSFNGIQPGIMLQYCFTLDDAGIFSIPLSFDYTFYNSGERVPQLNKVTYYLQHSVFVPSVSAGFRFFLFKIPRANVRFFSGINFRVSLIPHGEYSYRIEYKWLDSVYQASMRTKTDIIRFGSEAILGFEGELKHPFYITSSVGAGVINLIGRDNNRGDLFTPFQAFDSKKETVTYNLYFNLMLQYKF